MKTTDRLDSPVATDFRQLIEDVGGRFDPRLGKAAGVATATILAAGAHRKELRKAGKQLRRKVGDALRYVRRHPWEAAALLAVTGAATMKAMEAHESAPDEEVGHGRPRVRRPTRAKIRRATRH